jgi:hypothetical protein
MKSSTLMLKNQFKVIELSRVNNSGIYMRNYYD